nr:flocculation protein FLO11-like [Crassostrea gigas]
MTVQSSVASMDATVPCTRTAEETSGMVCSATVSTETSSSIRGATLSEEMSPTIWATPEIDSTERTTSPAIPVERTLCEITFGSSAERSSDTFIPSGDSTSLVSEESMTVQSSVASMDATVPCTSTAEETSGMMCSATVSTETSSSIRGATLSEEMSPTIWATPEIDSTERTSSPAIPVESTLCEITFGSSAERSSDTFIPSGDSTSLVSEESMTVQSSVASMKKMGVMSKDATVPHSSTVQKTPGMISSTTVSTETSSSILGATLLEEMSPTIWTTPEIDSTETRSNSTIPFKSTSCEITFGSSEELSSDTFIPSGDSTSLVSEESMTVQSSVASMDATVPCTSTAEETSGMMCSATVSTETSSSIRGATLSEEMSPTIWATPEIDSTERTSSPAIPVESTLCEITFGSSAERSSDTFIPSGDSTSLVSEESMTVQSSVASMKKMGVMSKDAAVPHSSTVQKTPGMISSTTVSTETSSSIRGATLSEEMSPTIWTTPEIDSTERTSSPAIPVESTSCEITIGSSAERSSDTFIPSGACTTSTMS